MARVLPGMGRTPETGYTHRSPERYPNPERIEAMKRLTAILLLMMCPSLAGAGELFPGHIQTGGYGEVSGSVTQLGRSESGVFLGGGGGLIINDDFTIGVHANLLVNDIEYETLAGEDWFIEYKTVDLRFAWILLPQSVVHVSLSVQGGLGWLRLRDPDRQPDERNPDSDTVFQTQPMAHIILNLTRTTRLSLGGGYRWVSGINTDDIQDQDAEGATAQLAVSFGAF